MLFYVTTPAAQDLYEIAVDDPGHGYLRIVSLDPLAEESVVEVAGPQLGRLVDQVLALALGMPGTGPIRVLGGIITITEEEAVWFAPQLVKATAVAIGSTERYQILWNDPDLDDPPHRLCANCNLGSPYHQAVTISEACNEFGHVGFGDPDARRYRV